MLSILLLLIALAAPFVLVIYGKRFLGDKTHPAALFILSWMASAFAFGAAVPSNVPSGPIALVWVVISFTIVAIARKLRKKSESDSGASKQGPDSAD